MNVDWTLIVVSLTGGFLGSLPGILALRGQYKKQRADASSVTVDSALKLLERYKTEYKELSKRVDMLEARINDQELEILSLRQRVRVLSNYANALIEQLIDIGVKPIISIEEIEGIGKWKS